MSKWDNWSHLQYNYDGVMRTKAKDFVHVPTINPQSAKFVSDDPIVKIISQNFIVVLQNLCVCEKPVTKFTYILVIVNYLIELNNYDCNMIVIHP